MPIENFSGLENETVLKNRKKFGSNSIQQKSNYRFLLVLKDIVTEPLFIILVFATSIYFFIGQYSEGIIMLVAIAFVSGISIYQENRSRNAVDALKVLTAPQAKVIRNGISIFIPSEELVIDDVIILEDGHLIPADAVILEAHDFSVNESILTGESLSVTKEIQETDILIFQGTMVTTGSCVARVTAIGKKTKLGLIGQSLTNIETEKTPLQLQINSFVKSMVGFGIVAFLIVWGINYYLTKDILLSLMHGLTLAMSVLPEEIPVAFSTFMALGAYHLYKKKVIAKSPHTVETLGTATVICLDKTGTITENNMHLASIFDYPAKNIFDYTSDNTNFTNVLEYAMWASEIVPFDNMEKSIHQLYEKTAPIDKRQNYEMVHEYPLGGRPPIMTHIFSNQKQETIIACKGSVEGVLNQCNGLSKDEKTAIEKQSLVFANKGYRVLGVAYSVSKINNFPETQFEIEMEFLGLLAFYDPPKKNIKSIFEQFYKAGIDVKMITGDYTETAIAIANQIEMKKTDSILTGAEVMKMEAVQLQKVVSQVQIFTRMFPEAKLKVIEALKAIGEVVAMTGDGVNDSPALKAAHIGIAMGLRGSEIAKRAASIILMDDNLEHIVEAVALGRRIYENLKKAIQYIISIHIPIILIVTVPLLLLWKMTDFFSPVHVIFLELIMGPTCSIIFEREPIEADSMFKKPRKLTSTFFSIPELSISIIQGIIISIACLCIGYYYMNMGKPITYVRTVIYSTLIFSNFFLTLVNRSFFYSFITTLKYKNNLLPFILFASLLVLFLSIYIPFFSRIFEFESISLLSIGISILIAFVGTIWVEFYKWKKRLDFKKK